MDNLFPLIDKNQIIAVINQTLNYIDKRLVQHGERVAYIVSKMVSKAPSSFSYDMNSLILLSVLHDIGAYKTEEIDEMTSFESNNVWSHSIYGYLFLKEMSPMGSMAEAILYHHLNYSDFAKAESNYMDYAAIIHLADRFDILCASSTDNPDMSLIVDESGHKFKPEFVDLLLRSNPNQIASDLKDGTYHHEWLKLLSQIDLSHDQAFEYLKMMVFSVDFRSEYTVSHTINTTSISVAIAKYLNLSDNEQRKIYFASLLHDIGKVAISPEILEFQGKLTHDQMEIMKTHVIYTREIIEGLVDDDICKIASRHHEKLDGTGYPEGLNQSDLTISEQIVAVADIVSALSSERSYKKAFPKEKTLKILQEMKNNGQLSGPACQMTIDNYDEIMKSSDMSRNPIIQMYEQMHQEFFVLDKKIRSLVNARN